LGLAFGLAKILFRLREVFGGAVGSKITRGEVGFGGGGQLGLEG